MLKQSDGLEFFYDATGLVGLKYNGKSYVYCKDIQGNIIAILDSTGVTVVHYKYDAWGNHKVYNNAQKEDTDANFIGNQNPFRYRSYYYDTETKLYYLKTRYYDPEVGRFINMDSIEYAEPETINGLNLYAYCGNNPVMNEDPEGRAFWDSALKIALAVTAIVAVAALSAVTGGAAGAVLLGAAIGGAAGFISGSVTGAIGAAINGEDVFDGFANGALTGTVIGGISGALSVFAPGIGGTGAAVLANTGSIALTAGKVAAGVIGLNVIFSRNPNNNIPMYGEPNSIVGRGHYEGLYDSDGHLIYRRDYTWHNGANPHTHLYKWWKYGEEWFYKMYKILPF